MGIFYGQKRNSADTCLGLHPKNMSESTKTVTVNHPKKKGGGGTVTAVLIMANNNFSKGTSFLRGQESL